MNTNHLPFTQAAAEEIADDFEDLTDTTFRNEDGVNCVVLHVWVTPFAPAEKATFITRCLESADHTAALSEYTGTDFDVVLVTQEVSGASVAAHMDIRSYATLKGIHYRFPV